jgi:hypothetical protein
VGSVAVFAGVDDAVAGDVLTRDEAGRFRFYQIRYLGNGVHVLAELDRSRFPPEDPPDRSSAPASAPTPPPGSCSDAGDIIDALVVYTGSARAAAGNTDPGITSSGIEAEIYAAVTWTNLAYANSDVKQRLRLVHMEKVTYSEVGKTPTQMLADLQSGAGGLSDVPNLRNQYSADVVVMIAASLTSCGKANVMEEDVSQAFAPKAYCVVRRSCSVSELSFGHELGHLMGANHEWGYDETPSVPPSVLYKHGYIQQAPGSAPPWHTIMAIDENCVSEEATGPCGPRLPYFSNPNVFYPPGSSTPTGVAGGPEPADNHRRLNDTAAVVANFRCASGGPNNVWMKDTDQDTGKEPDPLTATQDMWKSPAIWVRNAQDTAGAHARDHETPRAGAPNWVYVEMQNGGGTSFGELEVYYANASTSLTWPTGWTLIAKPRLDFAPATATRIVEVPWTPPQAGHFCLLARWTSPADQMAVAESAAIEPNVRNNNNLVWKNLEVIDLRTNSAAEATFEVRAPEAERPFSILVRAAPERDGRAPELPVSLTLELDDALVVAWRRGGGRAANFKAEGRRFVTSQPGEAALSNLSLRPGAVGRVKVTFRRLGPAREPDFVVDVFQIRGDGSDRSEAPIGGVSYVVRTGGP